MRRKTLYVTVAGRTLYGSKAVMFLLFVAIAITNLGIFVYLCVKY